MQLTKFVHSCVRLDDGDRRLLIDPGAFSDLDAALDGVSAVLVTHDHFDHLDADRLRAAAGADPRLRIWAPASIAEGALAGLGEQVVAVGPGEAFEAGGFPVQTFGGQHAVLHPSIPVIANVGYLVDGAVYHPGDSFTVPSAPVSTLLVPTMAPWSKLSEVIDFAVAVRAPHALPIHDFLVKDVYTGVLQGMFVPIVEEFGVEFGSFDATVDA